MTQTPGPRPIGTLERDAELAQRFVSLADTLVDDYDLVELLGQLVDTCIDLLGVTDAGLLLLDRGGSLQPVAASTEATRLLELFQLQNDEGPCLDCVRTHQAVSVPDIAAEQDRWPMFSVAAAESGYRAVTALPMRLRQETIGSLNLFQGEGITLTEGDQRIAQSLADVATIGILQQRSRHRSSLLAEQLQQALNSRIVIEQAKGVLAESGRVDMDSAFTALRSHARSKNLKLSAVAEGLVIGAIAPSDVLRAHE